MMVKQTHSKTLEFTVLAILSVTMFSRLWTQMARQPITHTQQQLNTFRHVDMVEDDLQKFTVSTRLAEKGHRSDFERGNGCWWSQDGLPGWEFHKLLLIYLHFHHITTTSRVYRERVHKEKASSCEEEKSLVDGSGSGLRWSCTAGAHCFAGKDEWDSETSFTGLHVHTKKTWKSLLLFFQCCK